MDFTLRQLRAFSTVARLRSFTRAADALHATQPALSAQIRELEEALGVRLFDRSTRSVAPTQAAADLLPVVEQVLAALALGRRARRRRREPATPGASSSPRCRRSRRRWCPASSRGCASAIRASPWWFATRWPSARWPAVRSGEVDLALTSAPPPDRELAFAPLLADRMMAVLPRAHPLARAKAGAARRPARRAARAHGPRQQRAPLVDAASASIGRLAEPAYEVAFMSTAIGLVRAGLGATLLPSSAAELARRERSRACASSSRRAWCARSAS